VPEPEPEPRLPDLDDLLTGRRSLKEQPEPVPEPEPEPRLPDLDDLLTGRRSLKEQLEARPELADELEELADVIGMLRELGQERRKKGESILGEDFLSPVDDEEPDEDV
jgi:hypothetical protein